MARDRKQPAQGRRHNLTPQPPPLPLPQARFISLTTAMPPCYAPQGVPIYKQTPSVRSHRRRRSDVFVRHVRAANLAVELATIRCLLPQHPYVTVHLEYPGSDDGSLASLLPPGVREEDLSPAQRYALAKIDVDAHPVLQLGITVSGSGGRLPVLPGPWGPAETVWQVGFHDDDAGQGVGLRAFAAALFGYGVVAAENLGRVTWVSFGGLYHFGFLLKILTFGRPLPDTKEEFSLTLAAYLGRTVFDASYIATKLPICSDTSSDLTAMAELLDAPAVEEGGGLWQAGEKSLAACQVFVRTKGLFFAWLGVGMHAGRIHGLH